MKEGNERSAVITTSFIAFFPYYRILNLLFNVKEAIVPRFVPPVLPLFPLFEENLHLLFCGVG